MRTTIAKFALSAALPLFLLAGAAAADETSDKLLAMCKAGDEKPETCECQVKAIVDNVDPRAVAVLVASGDAEAAADQAAKDKIIAVSQGEKGEPVDAIQSANSGDLQ